MFCFLFAKTPSIKSDDKSDTRQDSDWKSVDIDDFEKADYLLKQRFVENLEKSYFNREDSILINRSRSYSPLSMQNECMNSLLMLYFFLMTNSRIEISKSSNRKITSFLKKKIIFSTVELNYADDLGYTEIPIPTELERLIVLHKKNQSLGKLVLVVFFSKITIL